MEPANEVSREGREQGGEGGGKQGEKENRERRKRNRQNEKIGYVGKGGGVAVWHFQFLPFARKATPCLTLTDFDFRLVKKGKGFRPPPFSVTYSEFAPSHGT